MLDPNIATHDSSSYYLVPIYIFFLASSALAQDPTSLVKDAIDYWRGTSSHIQASMIVQRPGWQRATSFEGWTKGTNRSLVRFISPPKDAGNASLKVDDNLWSFSPKVNKVIEIPPSMMGQSWMGSDFSYNDLAKADNIVRNYSHKLLTTEEIEGKKVYIVEALPHETAAVVWGKEILKIREDKIVLAHEFYDQDGKLVKRLRAITIEPLGGKLYAKVVRMEKIEDLGEWTEVHTEEAEFGKEILDETFTLSYLRNPRRG